MKITEQIKTYEDACKMLGVDGSVNGLPFSNPVNGEQVVSNSDFKLKRIVKAMNEGWVPNWKDCDERKYYLWMDLEDDKGSGLGLSFNGYDYVISRSFVGSRLVLRSSELAKYVGTQFIELYADIMIIKD
jgi:hypothetical protein